MRKVSEEEKRKLGEKRTRGEYSKDPNKKPKHMKDYQRKGETERTKMDTKINSSKNKRVPIIEVWRMEYYRQAPAATKKGILRWRG